MSTTNRNPATSAEEGSQPLDVKGSVSHGNYDSSGENISRRRSQTQDRLIEAALTVFAKNGVAGSSVEQVCEAAGFTRGAFYSNFDSKDELMLAAYRKMAEVSLTAATELLEHLPDGPLQFELSEVIPQALNIVISQGTDDNSIMIRYEVRLLALRHPELRIALNNLEDELTEAFARLVTTALARFGLTFTVPPTTAIRWITAVFDHEASQAVLHSRPFTAEAATELAKLLNWLIQPAT